MTQTAAHIAAALAAARESDARWTHIRALHQQGDVQTLHAATKLLDSKDPEQRELAVDILAQLGQGRKAGSGDCTLQEAAADLLLPRLSTEEHPHPLQALASAFGHLEDPRAIPLLVGLRQHPNPDVRRGVVFGLLGHDNANAVTALIDLSRDSEHTVRDWATFGLGTRIALDEPRVREALRGRLYDTDGDARAEAILGLARRGDEGAIAPLMAELEGSDIGHLPALIEESLVTLGGRTVDPRICELIEALACAVEAIAPEEPLEDDIAAALGRCRAINSSPTAA